MIIKQKLLESGWGPGGWQFHQPETDWHAPDPLSNNFAKQVQNIKTHREANPKLNLPTDEKAIAQELEEYNVARWRSMYSEHGLSKFLENPPDPKKKVPNDSKPSWPSRLGKVVERAAGVNPDTLLSWFGHGLKPAPQAEAVSRAAICAGCDGNMKTGWRALLTNKAGAALKEFMQIKNELQLKTPYDDFLGMCKVCKCCMEVKVWTPMPEIRSTPRTEEELAEDKELAKVNPRCWILA